jgi:hypothetical protein
MPNVARHHTRTVGPRQPEKRHSHNENVDEPAKLIDDEAVDIEREVPSEGNESVERNKDDDVKPPAFEE